MIQCIIPCSIKDKHVEEIEQSLVSFSESASCYGFNVFLSYSSVKGAAESSITLQVDDEMIRAMKGAKRGPKEKATSISVSEMLALKKEGRPPKEIAEIAGISIATYFRRMAAYKSRANSEEASRKGE